MPIELSNFPSDTKIIKEQAHGCTFGQLQSNWTK